MATSRICSVEGCDKPHGSRGFCKAHARRHSLGMDMTKPIRVPKGALLKWLEQHKDYRGDQCLIWPFGKDHNGYGLLKYGAHHTGAHRVMCILAHGEPPEDMTDAAHSCGKGHTGCVHPQHLVWKTRKANHADKVEHGTHNRGERQHMAKLTEDDVLHIRAMKGKVLQRELAAEYGVGQMQICRIQAGKNWAWLP